MTFTDRQLRYIGGRAAGMGGAQAAREAGYASGSAKVAAAKLERRADIQAAIAEARGNEPERGTEYRTAQAYLEAVVAGIERPDPIRVSAARALIAYQAPRQRRPLPPAITAEAAKRGVERAPRDEWARTVAEIRSKLGRNKPERT